MVKKRNKYTAVQTGSRGIGDGTIAMPMQDAALHHDFPLETGAGSSGEARLSR